MWYLDDQAKYLRQTIVLTSYITPEISSIFNSTTRNFEGLVKYQPLHDGSLLSTGLDIKQTFSKIPAKDPQGDPDARFSFFASIIIPWILRLPRPPDGALGVLVFIPSYFDFVRVRNYFSGSPAVSSIAFGTLSENHTPTDAEVRRARSHFLSGRHSVLLYSGRAHHFYRYLIKGVKRVVVYQLPDNPLFYREIVSAYLRDSISAGRMAEAEGSIRVLFSRWDFLKLERTLGTERAGRMMKSEDTFEFI
jgi:U3 small nucleolar RNA-associated protein 25